MNYTSQNQKDKKEMLDTIGIRDVDELFDVIPKDLLKVRELNVAGGKTEQELLSYFSDIASKNKVLTSFRGAGVYDHFVPSLVGEIIGRSEFWTAYTPYQAEASQGTLQMIFEYQSLICALTGLDTSNASLYDAATAVAEAALLALRVSKKNKILISSGLHPEYMQVVKTYLKNSVAELVFLDICCDGTVEKESLDSNLDKNTAAVIIQSPNYFGIVEDMQTLSIISKKENSLFVAVINPLSLGVFKTPGEYNADIAVGEGQVLGSFMNMGGSTFGFMVVKKALEWKMPGRIVGQTIDKHGNRGFVLTLQSREQHVRREKATSNICTNASLNALAGCVFLSGWGDCGFKKLAEINISKARYAFNKIKSLEGFKPKFGKDKVFFNEFVIETQKDVNRINDVLLENKILGPLDLSTHCSTLTALGLPETQENFKNCLLFCVTEQRTKCEIDELARILYKI
ncbi:MAG: aminomethyl-transferring glycine dehydrogenase subunit GcvPA [Endomicrobium sp.]|jgi:glycine dehydrogenase subunit 1|nr:aminomethyl-transferring glycine dehydrogenase subunit GcvPA [Endomicrobium sp.]